MKFQDCLLTETDKDAIVSGNLLNNQHINYAQTVLHNQFPLIEELHNTVLQRKKRQYIIKCGIQIIHVRGNHWVVTSTNNTDQTVQVFDLVYSTVDAKTVDVINNIFVITGDTKIDLKRPQYKMAHKTVGYLSLHCNSIIE